MIALINGNFGAMPVLLHAEYDFGLEVVAKDLDEFGQAGFDLFADAGSDFKLPAGVFHVHQTPLLIRNTQTAGL
jgi:hypothetical protein